MTFRKLSLVCLTSIILLFGCSEHKGRGTSADVIPMQSPTGQNASLPHLVTGEDGNVYLSWVEKQDSGLAQLKYAMLDGDGWSDPELIAEGDDWFVNWADYPMIAVDKQGNMLALYLVKSSSGTYSYDIHMRYKASGGDWGEPVSPHTDGTFTEHGFATILPNNDGSFRIAWLDGRNTGGDDHDPDSHHSAQGAMTLRTAVIHGDGSLTDEAELDQRVCDCCQTTGVRTDNGVMIVYRDRSQEEIRDMSFVRITDSEWSVPAKVAADNWEIYGCPVNGPRAATTGEISAVAWFTGANEQPVVKVIFSDGDGFDDPVVVDDTAPLGRVDIVMLDDETAIVSWLDRSDEATTINYRTVRRDGSMSEPVMVTETDGGRGTGFPQTTATDDAVVFAWTAFVSDAETAVRLARVNL